MCKIGVQTEPHKVAKQQPQCLQHASLLYCIVHLTFVLHTAAQTGSQPSQCRQGCLVALQQLQCLLHQLCVCCQVAHIAAQSKLAALTMQTGL